MATPKRSAGETPPSQRMHACMHRRAVRFPNLGVVHGPRGGAGVAAAQRTGQLARGRGSSLMRFEVGRISGNFALAGTRHRLAILGADACRLPRCCRPGCPHLSPVKHGMQVRPGGTGASFQVCLCACPAYQRRSQRTRPRCRLPVACSRMRCVARPAWRADKPTEGGGGDR